MIKDFMKADHRDCDEKFATLENAVQDENWKTADELFEGFASDLIYHFDMEEKVMFPAFEARAAGAHCNPSPVMIMEHTQMRNLVENMKTQLDAKDKNKFFGFSETLMMTMQQHNMKEEQMMYPLVEEAMGDEKPMLLAEMKDLARAEA
jgi:hemerythrin-like domain-containing protein